MTTDIIVTRSADNYRIGKSKTILTPAAETYWVYKIPRYSLVTDVWLYVPTAGSTDTVSVGWAGNGETAQAAGFMSTGIANVMATGMKRAQHDTLVAFEGKWFDDAGGLLTMTVGTTQTTGEFHLFVTYTVIHS
jgi:hypothetical protein